MGSKVSGKMAAASRVVQVNTCISLNTVHFAVTYRSFELVVETIVSYPHSISNVDLECFYFTKCTDFNGLTDALVDRPSFLSVYRFI